VGFCGGETLEELKEIIKDVIELILEIQEEGRLLFNQMVRPLLRISTSNNYHYCIEKPILPCFKTMAQYK
jgi:hypothetical protein